MAFCDLSGKLRSMSEEKRPEKLVACGTRAPFNEIAPSILSLHPRTNKFRNVSWKSFLWRHYEQKNYQEAKSLAEEALYITERCGYVLQGADVNLFLAQYALEQEKDKAKAKEHAETALKLAYCDGPPYYYKVAYEEAERLLERLK